MVGEVYLRVQHQLLGIPGTTLDNVQEIHTQDHAMEQCGTFLHGGELHKGVRRIEQDDTAESARLVAQWQDPTKAAIASSAAGELHGLEVIRSNVQDDPDNITRFLHLERLNGQRPEPTDNKSSVLVRTKHLPGALVDVLLPFKEEDINVSNLHLGYVPNSPFDMRFLLEFDAGLLDARAKRALAVAGACALELAVLGSYRSAEIPHSSNGHKSK